MSEQQEAYKEKFRPQSDVQVDQQVDSALAGMNLDQLYSAAQPQSASAGGERLRGTLSGRVTSIKRDDVFVDFGGKNIGIAPVSQFEMVKIGDELEFTIERYDEREALYIVSRKGAVAQSVSWETLETGQIVEGTVTGMNKGGLELQIKNMRAFMPAGQVDVYFHKDISNFIGERWTVEVTRVDREKKNLIVSRRVIIEREKQAARDKLMAELAEGQVRRGVVRSVMDYGAFVDLGGVDGLVHVSELAHRRVRHASEVVKEGDLVDVKIVKLDKETGKVSLSLRQALADPWAEAATRYAVGTPVTARVARIENFGAFLDVEEGVDGLLPVSEISYQRIRHPSDVLQVGQTVKVVVLNIDPAQHKLSFSLKQAGPDPWQEIAQKFAAHSIVGGKVTRVVDFGAFVELEPGVEGLVHISELAPQRVKAASDIVKPGQEVKVRVLEVESEKRRIALSIKRAVEPKPPPPPTPEQLAAQKAAALKREKDQKRRAGLRGGLDF
jgi:small subunit ribosomal protein S1